MLVNLRNYSFKKRVGHDIVFFMRKKHHSTDAKQSIVNLYEDGADINQLSKSANVSCMTIYRWVREFRKNGSMDTKKYDGRGRPSKIEGETANCLLNIIKTPASIYGFETNLWNTTRIQSVCKKELGVDASRMAIWRFLTKFDKSFKTVKKEYFEASKRKQDNWVKNVLPKIKEAVKKHKAILYFEDESSIQLSPVMGKSWGDIGEDIEHQATGNKGSIAAISAISNDGKLFFNLFDKGKRFNSDDIIEFLEEMLKQHPRRHLVVVMDRASCHTSKKTLEYMDLKMHIPSGRVTRNKKKKNKRLHIFFLPPRSPKLNPDEQVWHYLKNHQLKSHQETSTKGLLSLANDKLTALSKNPEKVMKVFKLCKNHGVYTIALTIFPFSIITNIIFVT